MAETSKIEWTDATWNPVTGCSIKSTGCERCYAMKLAATRLRNHPSRHGLTKETKAGPIWNGEVRFNEGWLMQPLQWHRPRMIFVCAHGDLFHENVPDEWIDRVFAVMALAPHHTFQVLTKRAERMRAYFEGRKANFGRCSQVLLYQISHTLSEEAHEAAADALDLADLPDGRPLDNVWLGVSAERQQEANARLRHLLNTPAAVRFVSAEPLIGAVDLARICIQPPKPGSIRAGIHVNALQGRYCESGVVYTGEWDIRGPAPPDTERRKLDWVIVGGESGRDARPMHPDWARSLRDQCTAAGVPFFFKQWGLFSPLHRAGVAVYDASSNLAWPDGTIGGGDGDRKGGPGTALFCATKAIAGRMLDGVEHNSMPVRVP